MSSLGLREEYANKTIKDLAVYLLLCRGSSFQIMYLSLTDYRPLDQFWSRMGYQKHEKLKVYFPWKDIDKSEEDEKAMSVWLKKWK
jgi:hypothetical protein